MCAHECEMFRQTSFGKYIVCSLACAPPPSGRARRARVRTAHAPLTEGTGILRSTVCVCAWCPPGIRDALTTIVYSMGRETEMCRFLYLRVHEAERQAHGDGQQPHEHDLEGDAPAGLVAAEAHRVAQAEVPVHGDGAQVHDGGGAEEHVQADPHEAVHRGQRKETWNRTHTFLFLLGKKEVGKNAATALENRLGPSPRRCRVSCRTGLYLRRPCKAMASRCLSASPGGAAGSYSNGVAFPSHVPCPGLCSQHRN